MMTFCCAMPGRAASQAHTSVSLLDKSARIGMRVKALPACWRVVLGPRAQIGKITHIHVLASTRKGEKSRPKMGNLLKRGFQFQKRISMCFCALPHILGSIFSFLLGVPRTSYSFPNFSPFRAARPNPPLASGQGRNMRCKPSSWDTKTLKKPGKVAASLEGGGPTEREQNYHAATSVCHFNS